MNLCSGRTKAFCNRKRRRWNGCWNERPSKQTSWQRWVLVKNRRRDLSSSQVHELGCQADWLQLVSNETPLVGLQIKHTSGDANLNHQDAALPDSHFQSKAKFFLPSCPEKSKAFTPLGSTTPGLLSRWNLRYRHFLSSIKHILTKASEVPPECESAALSIFFHEEVGSPRAILTKRGGVLTENLEKVWQNLHFTVDKQKLNQ